jgi:hypothetical protein
MHRRSTQISLPLVGYASLVLALALVAGCGVTGSQVPRATGVGSPSMSAAVVPQGPQLGYVWDGMRKNVYPLLGVAGAAQYGAAVPAVGAKYVYGAVSGSGAASFALLLDGAGTLDVLVLPSGSARVMTTRVPVDASIVFAPGGGYAVVESRSANTALLVSGLPGHAQVAELAVPAGSALAGVAVSDRGTVLAGWAGASGVQVGVLAATGATAIGSLTAWGGAGFVPGGAAAGQEQAVVADGSTGQLTRLSGIGGSTGSAATATALASGGLLQTPVAVAVSGDGGWAFVADGAKQQVVRVDLVGTTAPVAIACACQPSRLVALPGNTYFEVSADQAGQPAWLLDGHAVGARTFFVPAVVGATGPVAGATVAQSAAKPAATSSGKVATGGAR